MAGGQELGGEECRRQEWAPWGIECSFHIELT